MSWFKVDRSLFEHELWQRKPFGEGQAWIDLFGMANWKDAKERVGDHTEDRPRGSLVCSDKWLCDRWGWGRTKVRNFLSYLEREQMINIKRTPKGTCITVEKYAYFQDAPTTDQTTHVQLTYNSRTAHVTHNKNGRTERTERSDTGTGTTGPSLDQVKEFCAASRLDHVDPVAFHRYYETRGWMIGDEPIQNWRGMCVSWNYRNRNTEQSDKSGHTDQPAGAFRYVENGKVITVNGDHSK